jgi:hypothetical protein
MASLHADRPTIDSREPNPVVLDGELLSTRRT